MSLPFEWFHCTSHTYGAWLHGDPRSFRTRHHREHILGDYKNPPPKGMYDYQLKRSLRLLKQPPVILTPDWRPVFGREIRNKLLKLGAQVLCVSMGSTHTHLLAKMPGGETPRQWIGQAKNTQTSSARNMAGPANFGPCGRRLFRSRIGPIS